MLRSIIVVAALLIASAPLRAEVTTVDFARLEQLREAGVPVIDLRTPEEWSHTGVIEGSHLVTFADAGGRYDIDGWALRLAAIAAPDEPDCAHLLERKAEQHRKPHPGPTVRLRAGVQRARRNGAMDCGRPGDHPTLTFLTGSDTARSVRAQLPTSRTCKERGAGPCRRHDENPFPPRSGPLA